MIVIVDNYDSFVYNLVQYIGEIDPKLMVVRNDSISVQELLEFRPSAVVLSPGPCTPNEAGICLEFALKAPSQLPILGVCLGHQSLAQAWGGRIVRAPNLMHGKISQVQHTGGALFAEIPSEFEATRYHSLVVDPSTLPDCFRSNAVAQDGAIMAFEHKVNPWFGLQFHPESMRTQFGKKMIQNFLDQRKFYDCRSN